MRLSEARGARKIRRRVYLLAWMLVATSCAGREERDGGTPSLDRRRVEKRIQRLVGDITSWSVWRGPCDAPSWRDFKLLLGKKRAYRELQRLFDELYVVGKDFPEEVLRQLCIARGGIELSYAAQWFLGCDPPRYAPVVARMISRPDSYVSPDDYDTGSSVGMGLKTPAQHLRGFLLYVLGGCPGILKCGDELPEALKAFDRYNDDSFKALAECDSMAAVEALIDAHAENTVHVPRALKYAVFGFHIGEWDEGNWRAWWEAARGLSFDEVVMQNMAGFFASGCETAPLMHLDVKPRWMALMSVYPFAPSFLENGEGKTLFFERLDPTGGWEESTCRRMRALWEALKDRTPEERARIGLTNAFRILRSSDSTEVERSMSLYVIKNCLEAEALTGIGTLSLRAWGGPPPTGAKIERLLDWWDSKPGLVWDGERRLFHAES